MNLYLTGGAVRDIISGFPFAIWTSPFKATLKLQRNWSALVPSWLRPMKTLKLCSTAAGKCARGNQHGAHRALR
jgi:hypothetical protein